MDNMLELVENEKDDEQLEAQEAARLCRQKLEEERKLRRNAKRRLKRKLDKIAAAEEKAQRLLLSNSTKATTTQSNHPNIGNLKSVIPVNLTCTGSAKSDKSCVDLPEEKIVKNITQIGKIIKNPKCSSVEKSESNDSIDFNNNLTVPNVQLNSARLTSSYRPIKPKYTNVILTSVTGPVLLIKPEQTFTLQDEKESNLEVVSIIDQSSQEREDYSLSSKSDISEIVIMASNAADDDVSVGSSNPGTPRSVQESEVRATPPPAPGQPLYLKQQQALLDSLPQQRLPQSKYAQLLGVIEDMGKDIRPTYSGSKTSAERLKRGIVHARILVRECLMECERSARS